MLFTIESDEDVGNEDETDEEIEMIAKNANSNSNFSIAFDDGNLKGIEFLHSKKVATQIQSIDINSGMNEEIFQQSDNVRTMPSVEARALRNATKSCSKNLKTSKNLENHQTSGESGMNAEEENVFFESVLDSSKVDKKENYNQQHAASTFNELNLSRPLLRALEKLGYSSPTPVQAQVIPLALGGRDVCASAITGSGKTAAFALPFIERLLYRPKKNSAIRVLVITPTRELATQIHDVVTKLTQFTDMTSCVICGGKKDSKYQEIALRNRPDIVICTPGRMLDHLRNSLSVSIDELDVLVLDEVDRLLDMGFYDEVKELVKYCPISRQTLLFSATMTPTVESLISLSLKRPIRIKTATSATTLAPRLIQEFIKLRKEEDQEAILCALVCRTFKDHTIVFFEQKKQAHRFATVLRLMNIMCAELHGDLPQQIRHEALEKFRDGVANILVCTDVAARGLDIPRVKTVINSEMPRTANTYVHRVGRTARAGCGGRAITLVSEGRRKMMKEVLKGKDGVDATESGNGSVLARTIPSSIINHYSTLISSLENEIINHESDEKLNKELQLMEREAEKAENLLVHENEINARPVRTWFQSEKEKKEIKEQTLKEAKIEEEVARVGRKKAFSNLSATEKSAIISRSDDYRLDSDEKDKLAHRTSRKKRRRIDAMKESDEDMNPMKQKSLELAPRRSKKLVQSKKIKENQRSAGEITMKRLDLTKMNQTDPSASSNPLMKKSKVVRQKIAFGGIDTDNALFGGSISSSKKKTKSEAEQSAFTAFDATKRLRKAGKVGKSSFKSKSKFKRR